MEDGVKVSFSPESEEIIKRVSSNTWRKYFGPVLCSTFDSSAIVEHEIRSRLMTTNVEIREFEPFVRSIARSICIDEIRKSSKHCGHEELDENYADTFNEPRQQHDIEYKDAFSKLRQADYEAFEVCQLSMVVGYSIDEIKEKLDISINQYSDRKGRGRKFLNKYFTSGL